MSTGPQSERGHESWVMEGYEFQAYSYGTYQEGSRETNRFELGLGTVAGLGSGDEAWLPVGQAWYKTFSVPMNLAPSSFCKHQVKPGCPV